MIIEKKFKWPVELRKNGGSYYILVTPEMLNWMGVTGEVKEVMLEADEKKHGKYIAVFKKEG